MGGEQKIWAHWGGVQKVRRPVLVGIRRAEEPSSWGSRSCLEVVVDQERRAGAWLTLTGSPGWRSQKLKEPKHLMAPGNITDRVTRRITSCCMLKLTWITQKNPCRFKAPWTRAQLHCVGPWNVSPFCESLTWAPKFLCRCCLAFTAHLFLTLIYVVWFRIPQELEQQFERERLSLEEHKTLLRQQLDELQEELTSRLTAANEEVGEPELQMCGWLTVHSSQNGRHYLKVACLKPSWGDFGR